MKKSILITVLILMMSSYVQAQVLQFGIKAGLNYANLNGSEFKTNAITSYHAGIVAEIKLLDKLSFQPELLYSTQGATYKNFVPEIKNELGYIAIPAVLKLFLSDNLSLDMGPQASFLLKEKNQFDINKSNTFDFSAVAGLGLKVTKTLFVQARYCYGLTEVSPTAKNKNAVVQLSAGIFF